MHKPNPNSTFMNACRAYHCYCRYVTVGVLLSVATEVHICSITVSTMGTVTTVGNKAHSTVTLPIYIAPIVPTVPTICTIHTAQIISTVTTVPKACTEPSYSTYMGT